MNRPSRREIYRGVGNFSSKVQKLLFSLIYDFKETIESPFFQHRLTDTRHRGPCLPWAGARGQRWVAIKHSGSL